MTVRSLSDVREYAVSLTPEQSQTAKRWFGSIRAIRNQSVILQAENGESTREKLEAFIDEMVFIRELPPSSIERELQVVCDSSSPLQTWASRKHDVQHVVVGPDDFELTVRATVFVQGLGEIDVHFDEGIPEPFPTKIELTQYPSGDTTIRIHYAGDSSNV